MAQTLILSALAAAFFVQGSLLINGTEMHAQLIFMQCRVTVVECVVAVANSARLTIKNNCTYTIWPATLTGGGTPPIEHTGFKLAPGASQSVTALPKWSGRVWARTHCSTDPASGRFSCLSGDCGSGVVECRGGGGAAPATLVEFTMQGHDGTMDFYDVSCVDGFNLPVAVAPAVRAGCNFTDCPVDLNSICLRELQAKAPSGTVVGCKSACLAFDTDRYCCRGAHGGGPNVCPPTNYSRFFKKECPRAYSYAYDDATSTFTCRNTDYIITFCP
ncbi:thaumatin-like protein 1b [Curcuma longa]|uniref:thaumatin-like protein 1b n=1 Tax=Curcuma longa TaxID=136217 RepID=UPI003D9E5FB3